MTMKTITTLFTGVTVLGMALLFAACAPDPGDRYDPIPFSITIDTDAANVPISVGQGITIEYDLTIGDFLIRGDFFDSRYAREGRYAPSVNVRLLYAPGELTTVEADGGYSSIDYSSDTLDNQEIDAAEFQNGVRDYEGTIQTSVLFEDPEDPFFEGEINADSLGIGPGDPFTIWAEIKLSQDGTTARSNLIILTRK